MGLAGWAIRISVKSVNHRFLDIKLRMPDSMEPFELRLRQAINKGNRPDIIRTVRSAGYALDLVE